MSIAARNKRLSLPGSAQSRLSINGNANIRHSGLRIHPTEYAGPVLATSAVLADYVSGISDWDIVSPDEARTLTLDVIPNAAPIILIHYRTTPTMTRQFGSRGVSQFDRRHFVTKFQTGVVVARARGPLGLITVCLRPEGAAALLGEHMQCFLDAEISLDAVFGVTEVALLEERLAEATTSAERLAWVEKFLSRSQPNSATYSCDPASSQRKSFPQRSGMSTYIIAQLKFIRSAFRNFGSRLLVRRRNNQVLDDKVNAIEPTSSSAWREAIAFDRL
jgi:hypothetical protein